MTSAFKIKISFFLREVFNSYTSHCCAIFSEAVLKMYGRNLHIQNVYYQPRYMSAKLSLKHLSQHSNLMSAQAKDSNNKSNVYKAGYNFSDISVSTEISRITSPALNSHVIAQYLRAMASNYNFYQICNKIRQKVIFNIAMQERSETEVKNTSRVNYKTETQLQGLLIQIRGRIPMERVRPRKTVQYKMLGNPSRVQHSLKNTFKNNPISVSTARGINPELGTFSV